VLTPQVTFTSLALFNILRFPMSMLAGLIGQTTQLAVSNRRVKSFLACEELDPNVVNRIEAGPRADNTPAVEIVDGKFTWEADTACATLHDLNLSIPAGGKLVAVVGQVGSGKSSLLAALLGEMTKIGSGSTTVRGSIAYVPQQAWIQNMSLQVKCFFISYIFSSCSGQHHVRQGLRL
jgi:ABC-type transport system involved in cytochrome bd biosynthesis fused ATPase/permease subunit